MANIWDALFIWRNYQNVPRRLAEQLLNQSRRLRD